MQDPAYNVARKPRGQWRCIGSHLPEHTRQGRPRLHGLRTILDAVFYVLKSGCPWRLLPTDFPPWKTAYDWFRKWRIDGTWERLNTELRERLRSRLGRDPNPSAWIVDSQSEDHRSGRRAKRLRRWQEGSRPQEAPLGGY